MKCLKGYIAENRINHKDNAAKYDAGEVKNNKGRIARTIKMYGIAVNEI